MTSRLTKIAIRIRSELNELEDVLLRIKEGWEQAQRKKELSAFADFLEHTD